MSKRSKTQLLYIVAILIIALAFCILFVVALVNKVVFDGGWVIGLPQNEIGTWR
jgi:hypothetical protein